MIGREKLPTAPPSAPPIATPAVILVKQLVSLAIFGTLVSLGGFGTVTYF